MQPEAGCSRTQCQREGERGPADSELSTNRALISAAPVDFLPRGGINLPAWQLKETCFRSKLSFRFTADWDWECK